MHDPRRVRRALVASANSDADPHRVHGSDRPRRRRGFPVAGASRSDAARGSARARSARGVRTKRPLNIGHSADGRRAAVSRIIDPCGNRRLVRRNRMDRETVLRHLRAWADGVDPSTGLTLPPDHPAQRPDTLRVMFAALALLSSPAPAGAEVAGANRPSAGGPRNAGRAWSADDDATLVSGFDAGETIGALAATARANARRDQCPAGEARQDRAAAGLAIARRVGALRRCPRAWMIAVQPDARRTIGHETSSSLDAPAAFSTLNAVECE